MLYIINRHSFTNAHSIKMDSFLKHFLDCLENIDSYEKNDFMEILKKLRESRNRGVFICQKNIFENETSMDNILRDIESHYTIKKVHRHTIEGDTLYFQVELTDNWDPEKNIFVNLENKRMHISPLTNIAIMKDENLCKQFESLLRGNTRDIFEYHSVSGYLIDVQF